MLALLQALEPGKVKRRIVFARADAVPSTAIATATRLAVPEDAAFRAPSGNRCGNRIRNRSCRGRFCARVHSVLQLNASQWHISGSA